MVLGDGEILAPVCGIGNGENELQMSGFEFVNMADYGLKDEKYTTDLLPYCIHEVIAMMKKMGYMPSMVLGKGGRGVVKFPDYKTQLTKKGLGFFKGYDGIKKNLGTLNGNFVKEGGDFPLCSFPELWVDKDGKMNPGWEIFFKEKLTFKEKPTMVIKEVQKEVDWMDYMDAEAMGAILKVEGDVLAITVEEPSDLFAFSMPTDGQLSNWTWVRFSNSMGKISCNTGSNILLNIFNKMNFDLAYFDVSHNIEILHLNDSKEFESKINKQLEKKIKPMEPILETINLGNDENPHLIKIGSTLSEQERKDLKELLTEFQEVFARSYEDNFGIDLKITQHDIDTHSHMVLVKKLRHMKTEWLFKIKEEVTKQLKVELIKLVHQAKWIAKVMPVPKKDGKMRMCVDFRDLNKACLKDYFPLPHIDVLGVNIVGNALMSFMDGFSTYNQIKMAPEDMTMTTFTIVWGIYCYIVMPFGLKNAGATYQRKAMALLHDIMHNEVKVYVNDMIVKSKDRKGHITKLKKFFERIKEYRLRLNP